MTAQAALITSLCRVNRAKTSSSASAIVQDLEASPYLNELIRRLVAAQSWWPGEIVAPSISVGQFHEALPSRCRRFSGQPNG